MKVTTSPHEPVHAESQYGIANYASFTRIIEAMKKAGEMSKEAEVIGIVVGPKGLEFFFKDWS